MQTPETIAKLTAATAGASTGLEALIKTFSVTERAKKQKEKQESKKEKDEARKYLKENKDMLRKLVNTVSVSTQEEKRDKETHKNTASVADTSEKMLTQQEQQHEDAQKARILSNKQDAKNALANIASLGSLIGSNVEQMRSLTAGNQMMQGMLHMSSQNYVAINAVSTEIVRLHSFLKGDSIAQQKERISRLGRERNFGLQREAAIQADFDARISLAEKNNKKFADEKITSQHQFQTEMYKNILNGGKNSELGKTFSQIETELRNVGRITKNNLGQDGYAVLDPNESSPTSQFLDYNNSGGLFGQCCEILEDLYDLEKKGDERDRRRWRLEQEARRDAMSGKRTDPSAALQKLAKDRSKNGMFDLFPPDFLKDLPILEGALGWGAYKAGKTYWKKHQNTKSTASPKPTSPKPTASPWQEGLTPKGGIKGTGPYNSQLRVPKGASPFTYTNSAGITKTFKPGQLLPMEINEGKLMELIKNGRTSGGPALSRSHLNALERGQIPKDLAKKLKLNLTPKEIQQLGEGKVPKRFKTVGPGGFKAGAYKTLDVANKAAKVLMVADYMASIRQGQGYGEAALNTLHDGLKGLLWLGDAITPDTPGTSDFEVALDEYMDSQSDIFDNSNQWETGIIATGLGAGPKKREYKTDLLNIAGPKYGRQLHDEAENTYGAVDVGWGVGDIEDLQALSKLSPEHLDALLQHQAWDKGDRETITNLLDAKMNGVGIKYESGFMGFGESIKYQTNKGEWLTSEEFDALTPDIKLQDDFAKAGLERGSIFTHDIHLEKTLGKIFTFMTGSGSAEAGVTDKFLLKMLKKLSDDVAGATGKSSKAQKEYSDYRRLLGEDRKNVRWYERKSEFEREQYFRDNPGTRESMQSSLDRVKEGGGLKADIDAHPELIKLQKKATDLGKKALEAAQKKHQFITQNKKGMNAAAVAPAMSDYGGIESSSWDDPIWSGISAFYRKHIWPGVDGKVPSIIKDYAPMDEQLLRDYLTGRKGDTAFGEAKGASMTKVGWGTFDQLPKEAPDFLDKIAAIGQIPWAAFLTLPYHLRDKEGPMKGLGDFWEQNSAYAKIRWNRETINTSEDAWRVGAKYDDVNQAGILETLNSQLNQHPVMNSSDNSSGGVVANSGNTHITNNTYVAPTSTAHAPALPAGMNR